MATNWAHAFRYSHNGAPSTRTKGHNVESMFGLLALLYFSSENVYNDDELRWYDNTGNSELIYNSSYNIHTDTPAHIWTAGVAVNKWVKASPKGLSESDATGNRNLNRDSSVEEVHVRHCATIKYKRDWNHHVVMC